MPSTFTINSLGTMTPSQGPASLGCQVDVMKAWAHSGSLRNCLALASQEETIEQWSSPSLAL